MEQNHIAITSICIIVTILQYTVVSLQLAPFQNQLSLHFDRNEWVYLYWSWI